MGGHSTVDFAHVAKISEIAARNAKPLLANS